MLNQFLRLLLRLLPHWSLHFFIILSWKLICYQNSLSFSHSFPLHNLLIYTRCVQCVHKRRFWAKLPLRDEVAESLQDINLRMESLRSWTRNGRGKSSDLSAEKSSGKQAVKQMPFMTRELYCFQIKDLSGKKFFCEFEKT